MEFIQLKDALNQMQQLDAKGYPCRFNLVVWNFSETRETGGDEVIYKDICLNDVHAKIESKVKAQFQRQKPVVASPLTPKNPHHFENSTRNVRLPNNQIRKIHIRFIKSFNGKQILY